MKGDFLLLFFVLISLPAISQNTDAPFTPVPSNDDSDQVFQVVEDQPEFPGGMSQLYKFLQQNIKYPPLEKEAGIQGKVFLKFVIRTDGSIGEVTVVKGVPGGPAIDKEAVRVVKMMPKWTPARNNGKPVNFLYMLPISFKLSDPDLEAKFPGGSTALDKYIYDHLKYPRQAKKDKTSGYVTVAFEVDKSGKVLNATVLESLGHGCDEEALRLVNSLPQWTPGKNQVENTKTSVRIKFELKKK